MPKKPDNNNPKCPFCNQKHTIKIGLKKNKLRTAQRYLCKNNQCGKSFIDQPQLQRHKTYPIHIILNAISNLNLGYSLKQTTNYFKKHKIKSSTLSYWSNNLKSFLPYHRIRNKIKINYKPIDIIKKKKFIHHQQPFLYQYHKPKLDLFLKRYPALKHYLENIEKLLPKNIFKNSERISQIAKETPATMAGQSGVVPYGVADPILLRKIGRPIVVADFSKLNKHFKLTQKQNYATRLADIALQITEDNKQRHIIIENLMLKNDTATIATEIPIYLQLKNNAITGHIDFLQIRFHKLHILDFKPEKTSKEEAITQLYLYALALSRTTDIPLKHFVCAFFNNKNYFEFLPY